MPEQGPASNFDKGTDTFTLANENALIFSDMGGDADGPVGSPSGIWGVVEG